MGADSTNEERPSLQKPVAITLAPANVDRFRFMLREQTEGDAALLAHYDRERSGCSRQEVFDRLALWHKLAGQLPE
jgi:hypothetical protein